VCAASLDRLLPSKVESLAGQGEPPSVGLSPYPICQRLSPLSKVGCLRPIRHYVVVQSLCVSSIPRDPAN
jgi:hypothetical protein